MSNLYRVTLTFPSSTEPIKKYLLKHEEYTEKNKVYKLDFEKIGLGEEYKIGLGADYIDYTPLSISDKTVSYLAEEPFSMMPVFEAIALKENRPMPFIINATPEFYEQNEKYSYHYDFNIKFNIEESK